MSDSDLNLFVLLLQGVGLTAKYVNGWLVALDLL